MRALMAAEAVCGYKLAVPIVNLNRLQHIGSINAVEDLQILPARQRFDHGSENTIATAIQPHFNGEGSHIFGRSVSNQRIERH